MKKKDESIYDQIYNFLFDIQASKKRLDVRRNKSVGDFGNSLLEIGLQPAIYPVGVVMDEMKNLIEQESSVQMGNVDRLSTGVFTSPMDIHRNVQRERKKRKDNRLLSLWASIGGNLDANGDGALLAMLAKKFDISSEEATTLGRFYRKIKKEENQIVSDRGLWSTDFMPSKQDKDFPNVDIELLGEDYKTERAKKKSDIMKMSREILLKSVIDSEDSLTEELNSEEIEKIITDSATTSEDERKKTLIDLLNQKGVEETRAKIYSEYLISKNASVWNENDSKYLSTSQDALYKALALRIVTDRVKEGHEVKDLVKESEVVERQLRSFVNNNKSTYGVKFQRILLTKRFIDNTASFDKIFLSGEWEKFETKGLGFTQIVKKIEVKDKEGNVIGFYYDNGDSVMGKLIGRAYYLHPKNFIKGVLVDGNLWLKLACGQDGKLNKKSLAYALYNLTPGRIMKKALNSSANPLNFLSRILRNKILNPFFGKITSLTKSFLRKFLGFTGVAGAIASVVLSFINDKFEEVIIQIVQIFIITLLGILFTIFISLESITNKSYESALLNDYTNISEGETFTDQDWELNE